MGLQLPLVGRLKRGRALWGGPAVAFAEVASSKLLDLRKRTGLPPGLT